MHQHLPLPSAAPQITGLARKLKLTHVSANCFPVFDLPSVLVGHSSPHVVAAGGDRFKSAGEAAGQLGRGRSLIVNGSEVIDLESASVVQHTSSSRDDGGTAPPIVMSFDGTFVVAATNKDGVNDGSISVVDTATGQLSARC